MADPTGFEPAISSVTGRRVNRATLQVLGAGGRIRTYDNMAYDATALTTELHRLILLRGPELHRRLKVMGLARYYSSTPRQNILIILSFSKKSRLKSIQIPKRFLINAQCLFSFI